MQWASIFIRRYFFGVILFVYTKDERAYIFYSTIFKTFYKKKKLFLKRCTINNNRFILKKIKKTIIG